MAADRTAPVCRGPAAQELARLEQRVNEAIALVTRLRREKAELEARLAAADQLRAEAAQRVQALLDRIDTLG
ncbi:MAG: hypothetical protein ABIK86_01050 [candidate division WOR-3 bacterium]